MTLSHVFCVSKKERKKKKSPKKKKERKSWRVAENFESVLKFEGQNGSKTGFWQVLAEIDPKLSF